MSKRKDCKNLQQEEMVDKLSEQNEVAVNGKKAVKNIALKIALAVAVILIVATGTIYSTAIFTSNTSESIVATFSTLNFETEVTASGAGRTDSQNVKYVANYFNDEPDSMLENAKVKITSSSLAGYLRVQAQYVFTGVADTALTDNLKKVISHLNANAVNPYNTDGAYIWTEHTSGSSADGYYYLTDKNGKPIQVVGGATYTFIEQSSPIKYNAISPLSLSFTAGEEQVMRTLALALNFECTQADAQYANIQELKLNTPDFNTSTAQTKSFGNILSFDTDGGEPFPAVITTANTLNLASYTPVKQGYTFASWMLNTTVVSSVDFSTSKTQQVKAKWLARSYNITYKDAGNNDYSGSDITSPTSYSYGTETALPQNPTKTGYTFVGWFANPSCTQAISVISATQTGDVTVYAKWAPNTLRIIYENMQGAVFTSEATSTFSYGSNISISLPTVYKNGYSFDGWYFNADGTGDRVTYLTTSTYTDNVTLYARFIEIPYQIAFSANGGTVAGGGNLSTLQSVAYSATTSFTLPGADSVVKPGYALVGWQVVSAPSDSNWQTNAIYMPGETYTQNPYKYRYGDVQMQAVWKFDLNEATLKLYVDGTQKASYQISIGETAVIPLDLNQVTTKNIVSSLADITPQKTNSVFLGWSLSASSTTAEFTNTYLSKAEDVNTATNTISLHAIYRPVAYYAITNNGATSSYSVYAVTDAGDMAYLFSTNSYELCFTGASKHCAKTQVTFHFGNSISAGNVNGSLNTGSDLVSFANLVTATTVNFEHGSIISTRSGWTKNYGQTNKATEFLYYVPNGKILNLGSSSDKYNLKFQSSSPAFSVVGTTNVNGGYFQTGTESSKVNTNHNSIFTTSATTSKLNIRNGNFIFYMSAVTESRGPVFNGGGQVVIDDGYFYNVNYGSNIYQENDTSTTTINGGTFVSAWEDFVIRIMRGSAIINGGRFVAGGIFTKLSYGSTMTVNDGVFTSLRAMFYVYSSESDNKNCTITVNGGKFTTTSSTLDRAVFNIGNGRVYLNDGEFTNDLGGAVIYISGSGTKSFVVGGNAKISAKGDHAIFISGSNDTVEIGGNSEVFSSGGGAIRKESLGTLTIKDHALITNYHGERSTLYISSGQANITGAPQIASTWTNYYSTEGGSSVADSSAITVTRTGKLHIYRDSSISDSTSYTEKKYINITCYGTTGTVYAIDVKAVDGTNPCFVVDDGEGYKYLKVQGYGNALGFRNTGVYAVVSDGLFIGESFSPVIVYSCHLIFNGHVEILKYADTSNSVIPGHNNAHSNNYTSYGIKVYGTQTADITIAGNAIIHTYDIPAIGVESGDCNTVLKIGGNAKIISDADSAIMFAQTGANSAIVLYQNPIIQTNNDAKAHISFSLTGQIYAKEQSASGSVLASTNNTSGEDQVIRLLYSGTSALKSNDIIVSSLESARRDNFAIINQDIYLRYISSNKTLVVGRQNFVHYDGNGGTTTIVDNADHQEGDVVSVIFTPIPTRSGYAFLGWSTQKFTTTPMYEPDGTTTFVMPSTSVTLYAVWKLQYVKMWYGTATDSATYHYSIDDALNSLNRNGTSASPSTATYATIELLKSNMSLSQTYMFADDASIANVKDLYGKEFTNYKQIKHPKVRTINFTASLSGTVPNYVLNLYASNNAFILGSNYNIAFSSLIIDGGSQSQARSTSGRLAYITASNSSVTLGSNTITQNFNVTSTDTTFDSSFKSYDGNFYGFGHGAYGGLILQLAGTFNINGNAIVQNCSVLYAPSANLVNNVNTNNRVGVFSGGSVVTALAGTVNVSKDAYIDSCESRFEGSYNSGNVHAWIDMFGAFDMHYSTLNMNGKIANCSIIARNSFTRTLVTSNDFDKIHARGSAISLDGTNSSKGTLNMGSSSDATIKPSIKGCYSSVQSYMGYVLGVAIHAYNYSTINIYNSTFDDLDGTGNKWVLGQSRGGVLYCNDDYCVTTIKGCTVTNVHANYASAFWLRGKSVVENNNITTDYGDAVRFYGTSSGSTLTMKNTNITSNSKRADAFGSCLFIQNDNVATVSITGGTFTSQNGACLYIGSSSSCKAFNTTLTNVTMNSTGTCGTIYSYGSGTLTVAGTSNITASGSYAVRLEGGTSENYINGSAPRTVFILSGGKLLTTSSSSSALYLNNIGLAQVTGGTINCGTSNTFACIAINNGNAKYKTYNRLVISGGTVEHLNTSNVWAIKALNIANNVYGRVEISGNAIVKSNSGSYGPVIWADGKAFTESNDDARKSFTNANSLLTIKGNCTIQHAKSGYVLQNGGTPFLIEGGTITTGNNGICVWMASVNSYCYVKGGTLVGGTGLWFGGGATIAKQYAYVEGGTFTNDIALVNVPAIASGSEPSGSMRYINISGGTFNGGASSTANGYIKFLRPTTLNISGGTFGSNSTSVTYAESNTIKAREIINVGANGTINISGGTFNAKEIFLNHSSNVTSTINISGGKIINFNQLTPGVVLNASNLNATFMLVNGSPTLNVYGSASVTAVTSTLFYANVATAKVNVYGSAIARVASSGQYYWYRSPVNDATTMLALGGNPTITSPNGAWISVVGTNKISATAGGTVLNAYSTDTSKPESNIIRINKDAPSAGNVMVVNCGTSNTNQDRFVLSQYNAGYYLQYTNNTLVIQKQTVEFVYNRNFMMKARTSSSDTSTINVGNFGLTGNNFTEVYYVSNTAHAFVEGKGTGLTLVDANQKLIKSGFARMGYTFAGWASSSSATTAQFANQATLTFTAGSSTNSIDISKIKINNIEFNTTDAWNSDARSFRAVPTNPLNMSKYQIRLYAVWTEDNYTVTFDISDYDDASLAGSTNGKTTISSKKYGDAINLNSYNPTRNGYVFTGWVETRTINNKEYVRIFYQDPYNTRTGTNAVGTFIGMSLANSASSNFNPNVYSFSNLKAMDNVRRSVNTTVAVPNAYTYYLEYPKTNITVNWSQTVNPISAGTTATASSIGYNLISASTINNAFQGLRQCNNQAYLKGRESNWYYSIGLTGGGWFNNAIPTYYNTVNPKIYADGCSTTLDSTSFAVSLWQQVGDGDLSHLSAYTDGSAPIGLMGNVNYYVKGNVTLKPMFKEIIYTLDTKGSTGDYTRKVGTNSLDDINAYLDNPATSDVTAKLTVWKSVTENRTFRGFTKINNLTTLYITSGSSSVVWNLTYLGNFIAIGKNVTNNTQDVTVYVNDIKITQGRTSATANIGRFAHVAPSGTLNIGSGAEFYNYASTWAGGVIWCEGILRITAGSFHDNYTSEGGGVIGLSNYASSTVDRTSSISGGTFSNNKAVGNGGVITAGYATNRHVILNISGGTFTGNTALNGGVIVFEDKTLNITNGTFTNNSVTDGGGVIYNFNSTITISGGTYHSNKATNGGVIAIGGNSTGTINISGGTFGGNGTSTAQANVATTYGGVLFQGGGTVNITGGTFGKASFSASPTQYANRAIYGGAIAHLTGGTLTISGNNTIIAGNLASDLASSPVGYGGGILDDPGSINNYNGGYIYGNYCATSGGGIHVKGTDTINGMTIGNDTYPNIAGDSGGGVWVPSGSLVFNSGVIGSTTTSYATSTSRANQALRSGGLSVVGGTVTQNGGVIGHNYSIDNSGGMQVSSTFTLNNGNIQYNTAGTRAGGIAVWTQNGKFYFKGGAIHHNKSTSWGAGVVVWTDNTAKLFEMTGGSIYNNVAGDIGGGLLVSGEGASIVNISGGSIYGNSALRGAGIFINGSGSTVNINGGTGSTPAVIIGDATTTTATNASYSNIASSHGGGICLEGAVLNIYGNVLIGRNYSASSGGGIYAINGKINFKNGASGTVNFTGHIQYNACVGSGGGIYTSSQLTLSAGYINNNKAGQTDGVANPPVSAHGGGIYITSGSKTVNTLNGSVQIYSNVSYRAGGVAATNTILNISSDNVKIYSNTSTNIGGGVGSWNFGTINLSAGKVESNTASGGGGVWLQSGTVLNLSGTGEISKNTSTGVGGGVYVEVWSSKQAMPNMNMSGGKIYANVAKTNGGGIFFGNAKNAEGTIVYSTLTITGGVIGDTTTTTATASAYSNKAENGGGIYYYGGILNMTNATIGRNYATKSGGGIYFSKFNSVYGAISFNGTNHIQYNFAGGANSGGGIYVADSIPITLNASIKLHHNNAQRGGGIYTAGAGLVLNGCEIYNNNATSHGGGGYTIGVTVQGTTSMHNNSATSRGGALLCSSTCSITGGTFVKNTADIGGAIDHNTGGLTISGGTFGQANFSATSTAYSNKARLGGAIAKESTGTITINNAKVIIAGNYATENGGGIYNETTGTITISNALIYGNLAQNGGAIYQAASGTLNFSGGTIGNDSYPNVATAFGGGINVNGGTFNFSGGTIGSTTTSIASATARANHATGSGGGIEQGAGSTLNMTGGTLGHNYSAGNCGGGIRSAGTLKVSAGTICYNYVVGDGGGIGMHVTGALTISGSANIHHNQATIQGGGVKIWENSSANSSMTGGTISDNIAATNGGGICIGKMTFTLSGGNIKTNKAQNGGGVAIFGGTLTYTGGNINNNTASSNGGGIHQSGGAVNMSNGSVYTNTATSVGGGVSVTGGTFTMSGGCIGKSDATAHASSSQYSNKASGGGGVYVGSNGTFVMNNANAKIYYNYATAFNNSSTSSDPYTNGGGGIYCQGILTMSNGNIAYNYATSAAGINLRPTSAKTSTISGGNIFSNHATTDGGGVYVGIYSTLNFSGGCVGKADATACATTSAYSNYAQYGAGVYVRGTFNMSGSAKVWYNYASIYAGGVEMQYNAGTNIPTSTVTMTMNGSSSIKYNLVYRPANASMGGGVNLNTNNCKLTLTSGDIQYNEARLAYTLTSSSTANVYMDTYGGGVCVRYNSTFVMAGGTVSYNKCNSTMTVNSDATVAGYLRVFGAGVRAEVNSTFTMSGGIIANNEAYANVINNSANVARSYVTGAGVYNSGLTTITGGTITGNKADAVATKNGTGAVTSECRVAGILVRGNVANKANSISGATISNNTITNGSTRDGGGLGVWDNNTYLTVTNTNITGNNAYFGGGIYVYQGKLTLGANVNIYSNTATGLANNSSGGGIIINGSSDNVGTVTINNATCKIYDNTALHTGGGISLRQYATLNMSAGVIGDSSKTAQATTTENSNNASYGGGIYLYRNASGITANISGSAIIAYNAGIQEKATSGGNIRQDGGTFNMSGNAVIRYGSSTYSNASSISLTNGTFNMSGGTVTQTTYNCVEQSGGTFNLSGGTLTSASTDWAYGTVYTYDGTFIMTGGTILKTSTSTGFAYTTRSANAHIRGGTIESRATNSANGGAIKVYSQASARVNLSGSPTIKTASGYHIYTPFASSIVASSNNVNFEKNNGDSSANGYRCIINYAIASPAVNDIVVTSVASEAISMHFGVVATASTGYAFMPLYGGTSGTYAKNIYLVSSGYNTSNTATATGMHYLGWLPNGASDANFSPLYNHNSGGTSSASINRRAFVWSKVDSNFGNIVNAYKGTTTSNYASKAYIASDTASSVSISSAITFSSSSVKAIDWFALNLRKMQGYHCASSSVDAMFTLSSGYTLNMYYISIVGNYSNATGLSTSGNLNVKGSVDISECLASGIVVNAGVLNGNFGVEFNIYDCQSSFGGGIYHDGGEVNLDSKCNIYDCQSSFGGGYYIGGGKANLGCVIGDADSYDANTKEMINIAHSYDEASNKAGNGGGIFHDGGELILNGAWVLYNSSENNGGGIFSGDGTLTIQGNSVIGGNYAENDGGGIYTYSTLTCNNASIIQNYSNSFGGGIYTSAITTISNTKIDSNECVYGGGIYALDATLTINENTYITNNNAYIYGGGIYDDSSDLNITTSGAIVQIDSNEAAHGGGIYIISATCTIANSANIRIYNNSARFYGGGMYMEGATVNFYSGTIYGNVAYTGGGVYIKNYSSALTSRFNMYGGTIGNDIQPNKATSNTGGGGITVESGIFNMTGGVVGSTTATTASSTSRANEAEYGAGIDIWSGGSAIISGGTVGRNYASINSAGIRNGGTLTISGGCVQYNYSANDGGGIMQHAGGNTTMNGGIVQYNTASNGAGIAMWDNCTGTLTINNGFINMNRSSGNGGGLYALFGTVKMFGGNIGYNTATNGGGIYQKNATIYTYSWATSYAQTFDYPSNNVITCKGVGGWEYLYRGFPVVSGKTYVITLTATSGLTAGNYSYLPIGISKLQLTDSTGDSVTNSNADYRLATTNSFLMATTSQQTVTLSYTATYTGIAYYYINFGACLDGGLRLNKLTIHSISCKENNVEVPFTFYSANWRGLNIYNNTASDSGGGIYYKEFDDTYVDDIYSWNAVYSDRFSFQDYFVTCNCAGGWEYLYRQFRVVSGKTYVITLAAASLSASAGDYSYLPIGISKLQLTESTGDSVTNSNADYRLATTNSFLITTSSTQIVRLTYTATYTGIAFFYINFGAYKDGKANAFLFSELLCKENNVEIPYFSYYFPNWVSKLNINGINIYNNEVLSGDVYHNGGGMYIGSYTSIDSANIFGNSATFGGGIYVNRVELNISNSNIYSNNVTSGAGVYFITYSGDHIFNSNYYTPSLSINYSKIYSNVATNVGGGIFVYGGELSLANGTVIGDATKTSCAGPDTSYCSNEAGRGAGVYLTNSAVLKENTNSSSNYTIAYNYASHYGGGIFATNFSSVYLNYGRIKYCGTDGFGPSIYSSSGCLIQMYDTFTITGNSGSTNFSYRWLDGKASKKLWYFRDVTIDRYLSLYCEYTGENLPSKNYWANILTYSYVEINDEYSAEISNEFPGLVIGENTNISGSGNLSTEFVFMPEERFKWDGDDQYFLLYLYAGGCNVKNVWGPYWGHTSTLEVTYGDGTYITLIDDKKSCGNDSSDGKIWESYERRFYKRYQCRIYFNDQAKIKLTAKRQSG